MDGRVTDYQISSRFGMPMSTYDHASARKNEGVGSLPGAGRPQVVQSNNFAAPLDFFADAFRFNFVGYDTSIPARFSPGRLGGL